MILKEDPKLATYVSRCPECATHAEWLLPIHVQEVLIFDLLFTMVSQFCRWHDGTATKRPKAR